MRVRHSCAPNAVSSPPHGVLFFSLKRNAPRQRALPSGFALPRHVDPRYPHPRGAPRTHRHLSGSYPERVGQPRVVAGGRVNHATSGTCAAAPQCCTHVFGISARACHLSILARDQQPSAHRPPAFHCAQQQRYRTTHPPREGGRTFGIGGATRFSALRDEACHCHVRRKEVSNERGIGVRWGRRC